MSLDQHAILPLDGILDPEDIYFRLQAFPQIQIIRTDLKPTTWPLIKI
jgi:hypothetical protein